MLISGIVIWDFNPGSLIPESVLLTTMVCHQKKGVRGDCGRMAIAI